MSVKLKYETGIAATIQFITITAVNFISGITSTVHQCSSTGGSCFSDVFLSIIYFLLLTVWFGILWAMGMAAQEKRKKNLALLLIGGEMMVALISLFQLTHRTSSPVSRIGGLIGLILSLWVSYLAIRLIKAKGGRVRPHKRIRHTTNSQS